MNASTPPRLKGRRCGQNEDDFKCICCSRFSSLHKNPNTLEFEHAVLCGECVNKSKVRRVDESCDLCFLDGRIRQCEVCGRYFHTYCIAKYFERLSSSTRENMRIPENQCPDFLGHRWTPERILKYMSIGCFVKMKTASGEFIAMKVDTISAETLEFSCTECVHLSTLLVPAYSPNSYRQITLHTVCDWKKHRQVILQALEKETWFRINLIDSLTPFIQVIWSNAMGILRIPLHEKTTEQTWKSPTDDMDIITLSDDSDLEEDHPKESWMKTVFCRLRFGGKCRADYNANRVFVDHLYVMENCTLRRATDEFTPFPFSKKLRIPFCDFYCGMGSFVAAFKLRGFSIHANDKALAAVKMCKAFAQLRSKQISCGPASEYTGEGRNALVIASGPPCQGFMALTAALGKSNPRKLLRLHSLRQQVDVFRRLVHERERAIVIFENIPSIVRFEHEIDEKDSNSDSEYKAKKKMVVKDDEDEDGSLEEEDHDDTIPIYIDPTVPDNKYLCRYLCSMILNGYLLDIRLIDLRLDGGLKQSRKRYFIVAYNRGLRNTFDWDSIFREWTAASARIFSECDDSERQLLKDRRTIWGLTMRLMLKEVNDDRRFLLDFVLRNYFSIPSRFVQRLLNANKSLDTLSLNHIQTWTASLVDFNLSRYFAEASWGLLHSSEDDESDDVRIVRDDDEASSGLLEDDESDDVRIVPGDSCAVYV